MIRSARPAIGLFLLILTIFTPFTNHPAQSPEQNNAEARITYPESYKLLLHPVWYKLPEKKSYLARIYQALLFDLLQIQRRVYHQNATPIEVVYPEEANSASSRAKYLLLGQKPVYFDLLISKSLEKIKFSPDDWSETEFLSLDAETFHLFSSIESLPSSSQQGSYRLSVFLLFGRERLLQTETIGSEDELVQYTSELVTKLRTILSGPSTGSLVITSQLPGSSIYLGGAFLGKTPGRVSHLIPGEYELILRKEGVPDWKTNIEIKPGEELSLSGNNREEFKTQTGLLRVVSQPPGADVYLDVTWQGKTPLVINNVKPGKYRLRLSHEGHIDQYRSVVIAPAPVIPSEGTAPSLKESPADAPLPQYDPNDETLPTFYVALPPGESSEHYQINPPVFLGLSYEQLFQGSALTTGGLLLGGIFCLTQYENLAKQANDLRSLLSPTPQSESQAASYAKEAATYKSVSDALFISAGVGLALSTYLFIEYIDSQDLDFALAPSKRRNYAFIPLAGPEKSGVMVSHFW